MMDSNNNTIDPWMDDITGANGKAHGLFLESSSDNNITNVDFGAISGNETAAGVWMVDSNRNNIDPTMGGIMSASDEAYGVGLWNSSDNRFIETKIKDVSSPLPDYYGFWIEDSSRNEILDGEIINCGHGIWIKSGSENIIERNIIRDNTLFDTGAHLESDAVNTEIHENCFYDNVPQAGDNGTNNNWTGNFWSDYTPPPPYLINGTANSEDSDPLDKCPLMVEQPDLSITEKSEEWVNATHYNVKYTVCNIGDALAGESNTTITIDGVDTLEDSVPALGVGECYTNTVGPFECTAPSDTIKVCADNDNDVAESNEMNNCMENVLECPAPARVPALTPPGIVLMIGLLALAGSAVLRRRE